MLRSITKNFSILIIAQFWYKILSFVSIAYVARKAGDIAFGQFSFALYLGLFFFALADIGISEIYVCDKAGRADKESEIDGVVLFGKMLLSIGAILFLAMISLLFSAQRTMMILLFLIGLSMIIDSFTFFLRSFARAREKMEFEAYSLFIEGLLRSGLLIAAALLFNGNIFMFASAFLFSSIATLAATFIICRKYIFLRVPVGKASVFFRMLKRGIPFSIVGFLSLISLKIDVLMLSAMISGAAVGWYSAAIRLIEAIIVLPTVVAIVVFPVTARLYRASSGQFLSVYKFSTFICIVFGFCLTVVLYLGSMVFVKAIFGTEYLNAIGIIKILSLIMVPFFLKLFYERLALVLNRIDLLLWAYCAGVALKVLLNLALIPFFGYKSAAIGSCVTESAMVIFIFTVLHRKVARFTPLPGSVKQESVFYLMHEHE